MQIKHTWESYKRVSKDAVLCIGRHLPCPRHKVVLGIILSAQQASESAQVKTCSSKVKRVQQRHVNVLMTHRNVLMTHRSNALNYLLVVHL